MPPSLLSLPLPALITLTPAPPPHRRRLQFAACAKGPPPRRAPYRRRPAPPQTPPQPQERPRPSNAGPRGAGGKEELEEAIYNFMRRSSKPGAFPTRAELLAVGRADLADAVESSGGWLSLGWSSGDARPASSGRAGVHPDYPPAAGLAPAEEEAAASERDAEASPSGRQPEEARELVLTNGIGLTRDVNGILEWKN